LPGAFSGKYGKTMGLEQGLDAVPEGGGRGH
jgi:hypothetical protein